jgi:Uma2 family endonuclease
MAYPQEQGTYCTFEEYTHLDEGSEVRSECYYGEVFAMAGATQNHNLITLNTGTILRPQARQNGCQAFVSDMKLELVKGKFYVYPDVLYTCHEADKKERTTLKQPALVVEVLSDKTEAYDLGTKLDGYLKVPSLLYYLIVRQKAYFVRIYERVGEKWEYRTVEGLAGVVVLPQLGLTLPMESIYEEVTFEPLPRD